MQERVVSEIRPLRALWRVLEKRNSGSFYPGTKAETPDTDKQLRSGYRACTRPHPAVAELESNLIKERVHMGISHARKQGKQLGRPKRVFDRDRARRMLKNMSVREVARQLGISRGDVERSLSQVEFEVPDRRR